MCLPNFIEFKQIDKSEPLIGYRTWKNPIKFLDLNSEYMDYTWLPVEDKSHKVTDSNSGLYAYNYYYYNYYNNYYNYYNNNNNYNNYNNNNYNYNNYNYYNNYYNYIAGIIKQWGKIAIHRHGQRSEYASIDKLFTIRAIDAKGPIEFLNWIKEFNNHIHQIAIKYNCKTIHWQDFTDSLNSHE